MYEIERTIVTANGKNDAYILQSFGKHTGFDMNRIPPKMEKKVFETRDLAYERFSVTQMYQTIPIANVDEKTVTTTTGQVFESKFLPGVLKDSETIVLIASALSGLEEVLEERTKVTEQMYLDGWATAILTSANLDLRADLKKNIEAAGYYTTSTWSPGQHGFEIGNQRPLFEILEPETIGIHLKESHMMIPQKSETMLFGISPQEQNDSPIPCTYCPHAATCPGAFSEQTYDSGMC